MIGAFTFSVRIPETINGFKVIEIGEEAFKDSSNLTKVTIPNNVTIINNGAFKGCHGLNEVIISNGIISIGESASLLFLKHLLHLI